MEEHECLKLRPTDISKVLYFKLCLSFYPIKQNYVSKMHANFPL